MVMSLLAIIVTLLIKPSGHLRKAEGTGREGVSHGKDRKERIDRGIKVRTEGIYAISSLREMPISSGPRLLLIVGLLLLPLVLDSAPYWKRVINIMCVYALLALSFDFLANYVGLVCLGGAFFIGVGGYFAAIFNVDLLLAHLPLHPRRHARRGGRLHPPDPPVPAAAGRLLRHRHPHVSAPLHEDHRGVRHPGRHERHHGHRQLPGPVGGEVQHHRDPPGVLFGMRQVLNQDIGLVLRAVKDNDQSVRASGISVTRIKALAVFIASLIGCFGGAYLAHLYMWAGISLFALDFSIIPIAAVTIGGGGTLVGAVIGCLILVPLSEFLRVFGTFRIVIYCMVLTGFIVFKSEGIMVYCSGNITSSKGGRRYEHPDGGRARQDLRRPEGAQRRELRSRQGEIFGIIGPNGSGKTTLINCITGFIRPDEGKVLFKGKDITALARAQDRPGRDRQDLPDHAALLLACRPTRTSSSPSGRRGRGRRAAGAEAGSTATGTRWPSTSWRRSASSAIRGCPTRSPPRCRQAT